MFFFSACTISEAVKTDTPSAAAFTIHTAQLWQSSWIRYLFTVGIMQHKKEPLSLALSFFPLPDALHYQIRGKHVFPQCCDKSRGISYSLTIMRKECKVQTSLSAQEDVYRIRAKCTETSQQLPCFNIQGEKEGEGSCKF